MGGEGERERGKEGGEGERGRGKKGRESVLAFSQITSRPANAYSTHS